MSATAVNITDIQSALGKDWTDLRSYIRETLDSEIDLLNKINEHLFLSSGKMLRPLLSLLVSRACGADNLQVSRVCAAASEIIHTATLLHDDVVDESLYRRGKITVNALFSPGASILMGDFWLSRAIKLIISNNCDYSIISLFAQTIEDLSEGEMLQMQRADDVNTTFDDYIAIIYRKTASLFIAAMCSAAIVERQDEKIVDSVREFAYRLGISFQMRDDILDYSATIQDGKDVGSDLAERKVTLPLLCAFENCPEREEEIRSLIREIDVTKGADQTRNAEIIKKVRQYVLDSNGVQSAKLRLNEYISASVESLSALPDTPYRGYIASIAQILSM
jgi:octaprenyl-diphosphate synthase